VVYGKASNTTVQASELSAGSASGFVITDSKTGQSLLGAAVSAAGDVNGDGYADVIVGAAGSNTTTGVDAGGAYVVFGKAINANLDTATLGTNGFMINGAATSDKAGYSVSNAGDVNGDGLSDVIVSSKDSTSAAGRSYVVFGKNNSTTVELSALGTNGFAINGQAASDYSGYTVSNAGDVNGDGLADLAVFAPIADETVGGRGYIVFGKTSTVAVNLSAIATGAAQGYVINGNVNGEGVTSTSLRYPRVRMSYAGDVNGDGLAAAMWSTAKQAPPRLI
jgi:hypothetical protein